MVKAKLLVSAIFFLFVFFGLSRSQSVETYIDEVKIHSASGVLLSDPYQMDMPMLAAAKLEMETFRQDQDELLEKIRQEAAKRNKPAVDAKLDSVWKAIPGLNGTEVDVDKTLLLARSHPVPGEIPYVMKPIPPKISLDDLGAQPIYKGNPGKPMVGLMINVAWGNEYIPKMLEVLDKENAHATFFLDGSWLKKNVPVAKEIMSRGHEMANHAYSHKNMSELGYGSASEEMSKTQALLEKELGVKNTLFAPPSGDFNQATVRIAREQGMRTILWTLDTVDWRNPGASNILRKIEARVEPGSLILMHPTVSSSEALADMIRIIKRKGLRLGTVSEVISPERVPES
ncbi:polysaccharide deacetylase family protein [Paenibacillus thalictri]|nr:polysaccharide deacetylase family protein [Paenibacillus thalictri]